MKKILIAFYSRTGTTKKVAEVLAIKLDAEIEEIKDTVDRAGAKGYLLSGRDATLRRLTTLESAQRNPADFDLVIIGTPIWSWNLSVPARTYLEEHKNEFKNVALLCGMGGSGDKRAGEELEKIVGKKPLAVVGITTKEIVTNNFEAKIDQFIANLNSNSDANSDSAPSSSTKTS